MPVGFSIAVAIIFIAGGIYCRGSKRLRTTSKCMLFFRLPDGAVQHTYNNHAAPGIASANICNFPRHAV